jgi:hypothetical protein
MRREEYSRRSFLIVGFAVLAGCKKTVTKYHADGTPYSVEEDDPVATLAAVILLLLLIGGIAAAVAANKEDKTTSLARRRNRFLAGAFDEHEDAVLMDSQGRILMEGTRLKNVAVAQALFLMGGVTRHHGVSSRLRVVGDKAFQIVELSPIGSPSPGAWDEMEYDHGALTYNVRTRTTQSSVQVEVTPLPV